MTGIIVEQALCDLFTDAGGTLWVSVRIPPRETRLYNCDWPDIIVPPKQVYCVDDMYNEVFVNAGANLRLCYKSFSKSGKPVITAEEFDLTEIVLARFLQYEHWRLHKRFNEPPLNQIYEYFARSGLTMKAYISAMRDGK